MFDNLNPPFPGEFQITTTNEKKIVLEFYNLSKYPPCIILNGMRYFYRIFLIEGRGIFSLFFIRHYTFPILGVDMISRTPFLLINFLWITCKM